MESQTKPRRGGRITVNNVMGWGGVDTHPKPLLHNPGPPRHTQPSQTLAPSPPPLPAGGPAPWVDDWVLVPYCTGLPFSTFLQALLLSARRRAASFL